MISVSCDALLRPPGTFGTSVGAVGRYLATVEGGNFCLTNAVAFYMLTDELSANAISPHLIVSKSSNAAILTIDFSVWNLRWRRGLPSVEQSITLSILCWEYASVRPAASEKSSSGNLPGRCTRRARSPPALLKQNRHVEYGTCSFVRLTNDRDVYIPCSSNSSRPGRADFSVALTPRRGSLPFFFLGG